MHLDLIILEFLSDFTLVCSSCLKLPQLVDSISQVSDCILMQQSKNDVEVVVRAHEIAYFWHPTPNNFKLLIGQGL